MRLLLMFTVFIPFLRLDAFSDGDSLRFLDKNEMLWLEQHRSAIRVAPETNYPPFSFISQNEEWVGLSVDILRLIENRLKIHFIILNAQPLSSILDAAQRGDVDVVTSIKETPERSKYLNFTSPYITIPTIIIENKNSAVIGDIDKLNGKKVAVGNGYGVHSFLIKNYPEIRLVPVDNDEKGLQLLSFGQVDAVVTDTASASYFQEKNRISNLHITGNTEFKYELRFGIRKDALLLKTILEKTFSILPEDKVKQASSKWISINADSFNMLLEKYRYQIAFLSVAFIVLLLILVGAWNISLRRKVLLQTRKLSISRDTAYSLAEEKQRYINIVDQYVIASSTDLEGIIQYASDAFCKISGYSKQELIGKSHNIVRHPDMPAELYKELWQTIKQGMPWKGEIKNRAKDGSAYWVDVHIDMLRSKDNTIIGFTAIRYDITDKKRVEHLSITDSLTNLYNRMKINIVLDQEVQRSSRYDNPLSIFLFDVDYFKSVNDTYGHQVGDQVLIGISELVRLNIRAVDIPGRWGGEEFMVICPETNSEGAKTVAEKLRIVIANHFFPVVGSKTCSFGIATRIPGEKIDHFIERADAALYLAKKMGRNQVKVSNGSVIS